MAKRNSEQQLSIRMEIIKEPMSTEEWETSEHILAKMVASVFLARPDMTGVAAESATIGLVELPIAAIDPVMEERRRKTEEARLRWSRPIKGAAMSSIETLLQSLVRNTAT